MTLILSGSDGLSDIDGSAATPAIRGTDANTGIFFPAADTIAFSEGGVESARFDSVGNLGIGITSPVGRLSVKSTYVSDTTTQQRFEDNTGSALSFGGTGGGVKWLNVADVTTPSTAYPLAFQTGGTERARIDSSGNFRVGPASTYGSFNSGVVFGTANTVPWTVDTTASTGTIYGSYVRFSGQAPNNTASNFMACFDTVGDRFVFRSNGGLVNYSANNANLSDRREKSNFAPATSYLAKICAIPVQTFNYIDQNMEEDGGLTLGVVAQDVQAVAPELVTESNWASKDEEPKMRLSIYQTDLQYALMKCIQEQQALITALTERIEALEAK